MTSEVCMKNLINWINDNFCFGLWNRYCHQERDVNGDHAEVVERVAIEMFTKRFELYSIDCLESGKQKDLKWNR